MEATYVRKLLMASAVLIAAIGGITAVNRSSSSAEAAGVETVYDPAAAAIDDCIGEWERLSNLVLMNPGDRGFMLLAHEIGTMDPRFRTVLQLANEYRAKSMQVGQARADELAYEALYRLCTAPPTTTTAMVTTTVATATCENPTGSPSGAPRFREVPKGTRCPAGYYSHDTHRVCISMANQRMVMVEYEKPCPRGYEEHGD